MKAGMDFGRLTAMTVSPGDSGLVDFFGKLMVATVVSVKAAKVTVTFKGYVRSAKVVARMADLKKGMFCPAAAVA